MSWLKRFKRWILRQKSRAIFDRDVVKNPLREFIYRDEVSLRSLLSSKKGEMTSTTSTEVSESAEAEVRSATSVGNSSVGKAELGSRFQTRNSSTLQTAKKATVQSWFRELDRIANLRTIETVQQVVGFKDETEIETCDHWSVSAPSNAFKRGDVVEFRVRLTADPMFHLVTLVSEFKAMAEDYPSMMDESGGLKQFEEIEGITRVLQRLMAGLIPVRALVLDYVIIEIDGTEYVTHVDAITELGLEHRQLEIGCVTELDAYWKDIRRVLFSDSDFTMLCRVSKSGIQRSWNPVKLTDLLRKLVPDLSQTLDKAAQLMFDAGAQGATTTGESSPVLGNTLRYYVSAFSDEAGVKFTDNQQSEIDRQIIDLETNGATVSGQAEALKKLGQLLCDLSGQKIEKERALELREEARASTNLPYFGGLAKKPSETKAKQEDEPRNDSFLDVEVVAMYW